MRFLKYQFEFKLNFIIKLSFIEGEFSGFFDQEKPASDKDGLFLIFFRNLEDHRQDYFNHMIVQLL